MELTARNGIGMSAFDFLRFSRRDFKTARQLLTSLILRNQNTDVNLRAVTGQTPHSVFTTLRQDSSAADRRSRSLLLPRSG